MDGSSDAPASSEQRAPAAALDLKDLNYFIIEAVNHNEPKARQLTEVLRDQQAIFSLADFRDCVRIDADGLRADILSALTKEKPGALRVWRAHLATLFDRALHSTASASASVAPSSPASVSPGSTSPVSKYSHFPWKHLNRLDTKHAHYWQTLYVCCVAGTPEQREDLRCACNFELSKEKANYNYKRHITKSCSVVSGILLDVADVNPTPSPPPPSVAEQFRTVTPRFLKVNLIDRLPASVSALLLASLAPPTSAPDEAALPGPPVPEEAPAGPVGNFLFDLPPPNAT